MKFHKRTRMNYWAHAKVLHWLIPRKPRTSFKNIEEMMVALNEKDPFTKTVVDKLQDIVMFPSDFIHSVKIYVKNCKGNTHVLDGGLEKGVWYDLDYRISQCLFTELEKFIEQEKGLEMHAWEQSLVWDETSWVDESDERFGLPTPQALSSQEQEVIYQWWKGNKNRSFTNMEDEAEYQKEEEGMLVRLIKIRHSLWT